MNKNLAKLQKIDLRDVWNFEPDHFDGYEQLNGFKTVVPQYVRDYAYHLTHL